MQYDYKISFELDEPFDVSYVNNFCMRNRGKRILVEVQNTRDITSNMLKQLIPDVKIRIAGGYDQERIDRYGKDINFSSNYYKDAVIYTRNEAIKILEEIEKIESGMSKNWSDIQKLLYVYDRLKTGITYDPNHNNKSSAEIRSLRGLITKNTVCAGYAMILKEIMDRNYIDCEYVEGHTKKNTGHAWNIVNIDGKKYPIDLTWDNSQFRVGNSNSFDYLGQDISIFAESHIPFAGEKTQNYRQTLSTIDPKVIKQLYSQMGIGRARDYRTTTYDGKRKDGSRFIVAQIGDSKFNNQSYYRYYYVEVTKDNKFELPIILYSDINISHLIDCKNFKKPIPQGYEEAIENILFSRENIQDSISKHTFYIGSIKKNTSSNKLELVSNYKEIAKPNNKKNLFIYPTRRYRRNDGSVFIAQQMNNEPFKVCGIDLFRYDIFEMVMENNDLVLKRNTVYTEKNFFKDSRQGIANDYLSRSRLDRKVKEAGGYIGYYSQDGIRTYNPDLVKVFETSKRIDTEPQIKQKKNSKTSKVKFPEFSELKQLALKYEIFVDLNGNIDVSDISKYKIRDIKTKKIITDKSIIDDALFANIWLAAAGVKYYGNEERNGSRYAFNSQAEDLYYEICKNLIDSCEKNGVINPKDLYKRLSSNSHYKYTNTILYNLFRHPSQVKFINKLFMKYIGKTDQFLTPEPLSSMDDSIQKN